MLSKYINKLKKLFNKVPIDKHLSDEELLDIIKKEVQADPRPAELSFFIDSITPVDAEMILHECDFAIDEMMDPYRLRYLTSFSNPDMFEDFVLSYKLRIRKLVRDTIEETNA